MVIQYYGIECFKVSFGETTLAFNPISKDASHRTPRFGADIVLVSLNHPDMNGIESVRSVGAAEPFVIDGPGEFEVAGVTVRGFPSRSTHGGRERINTMYIATLEDMRICHLGAMGDANLPPDVSSELDDIDILIVPIGGGGVLDPKAAHRFAVELEPHIIIPCHGDERTLAMFLKEEGASPAPVDKATLKKRDIEKESGTIIVLTES